MRKFHQFFPPALFLIFYLSLAVSQGKAELLSARFIPNKVIYFEDRTYTLRDNETLVELAVRFQVGYQSLLLANPGVDPWIPKANTEIIIPHRVLVPPYYYYPHPHYLVINLPEMRLYYFRNGFLSVFPIGIGVSGKLPPEGKYFIKAKKKRPTWYPTESIRAEDPALPKVVPPGPENPLGEYALYLDRGLYAIHGTNRPPSVGRRTTHGCFRLYDAHIEFLFNSVPLRTPVYIIYDPYKIGIQEGKIYLQPFPDVEARISNPLKYILNRLDTLFAKEGKDYQIDLLKLDRALELLDGRIYEIGRVTD